MSAGMIHDYPNTASGINNTSYIDVDQEISSGVWQSQKMLGSVLKGLMLSENIEQIHVSDLQAKAAANQLNLLKQYYIDDAASGDRLLVVRAATVNTLFQSAFDLTTGATGVYDLGTDTFIGGSGTYTPTLTPDGSVCTNADPVLAKYSLTGEICTVTIHLKQVDLDFSAGSVGTISIDTLPFAGGDIVGNAQILIEDGSWVTTSNLILTSLDSVSVSVYCPDTGFATSGRRINVQFQYKLT